MAILKNWDPLRMPRGSVRAIVALAVVGVLWAEMLLGRESPAIFRALALLIIGHFFGSETNADPERKAPLNLPRGSVRFLIVAGFAAVGYRLWREGELRASIDDRNFTMILIVGSLVGGVFVRRAANLLSRNEPTAVRRFFENAKSVVVLAATALLAAATLADPGSPETETITLFVIPLVSFYFGSR